MYPFDRLREQTYMKPCESAIPRLIVIDGSNIARSSCGTDREDLDVVVFLPVIYNNNYNFNATNAQVLPKLRNLDVLTFTPARAARSGRSAFINYDDLYILEFAERHGGNVLSGDRFYDIAKEYTYRDYRQIIKERRIDVIFRPLDADFVEYGRDRFFRFLPELRVLHGINSSMSADERMQRRLYCLPSDKDYNKVVRRREFWTSKRRDEIVSAIDVLLDEIATKNCLVPKIIPVQIPSSSKTEKSTDEASSASCASTSSDQTDFMDPKVLTERWLSPPAQCKLMHVNNSCESVVPPRRKWNRNRKLNVVRNNR